MTTVAIIIPVYNLSWMTINLLDSIKSSSKIKNLLIIIIDNGSSNKETKKVNGFLEENSFSYKLYKTEKPLGFVKAINKGIDIILDLGIDYFFILNNDTIVTSYWDIKLLKTLKKKSVGIVGPMSSPEYWPSLQKAQKMINSKIEYFQIKDSLESFVSQLKEESNKSEKNTDFLEFFCVGIKTSLIKKIGKLDEAYNIGLFDDNDYCYRTIKAGYKIILRQDAYVHHYHRSTFTKNKFDYPKLLEENRQIFVKKHGFDAWINRKEKNHNLNII